MSAEWTLLSLRYGFIAAGVAAGLWDSNAVADGRLAVAALLLSLMLLMDLPGRSSVPERKREGWMLGQAALAVGAFVLSPGAGPGLIVGGVLVGVAAKARRLSALLTLGASAAATVFTTSPATSVPTGVPIGSIAPSTALALLGVYVLALATGRVVRLRLDDVQTHRETVDRLEAAQRRLEEFAETSRQLAASNERQRLAEELHDALGHALVGTLLQLQVAARTLEQHPSAAKERLDIVEQNLRETIEQVREALRRGTRRTPLPLSLALETAATEFTAAGGPRVELRFRPDGEAVSDVTPEVAEVLYRTAREAMTNAVRHGRATRITVELESTARRLFMSVRDDGVGAEQYAPGMGLTGMVSRVQSIGGSLRIRTAPGAGFSVEVGVRR